MVSGTGVCSFSHLNTWQFIGNFASHFVLCFSNFQSFWFLPLPSLLPLFISMMGTWMPGVGAHTAVAGLWGLLAMGALLG